MTVQIKYTVHSCSRAAIEHEVEINGATMTATVPGLIVELVSEDGSMTHTLRLLPNDIEHAESEFAVGNTVQGTFYKIGE